MTVKDVKVSHTLSSVFWGDGECVVVVHAYACIYVLCLFMYECLWVCCLSVYVCIIWLLHRWKQ